MLYLQISRAPKKHEGSKNIFQDGFLRNKENHDHGNVDGLARLLSLNKNIINKIIKYYKNIVLFLICWHNIQETSNILDWI